MGHEVTIRQDGSVEAAYALLPAWHGLGKVIDHAPTSDDMIKLANLDWEVTQEPVFVHMHDEKTNQPIRIAVPDTVANVRSDNKQILGIVSERYALVQNWEAFDFTDNLHQDGIIRYEAAGSLKGGKFVWLLARMPNEFKVAGNDKLAQYILFTTAHDGSRAVRVIPTSVRVVCWNTLSLATADESKGLSIRHKGNIKDKLEDARKCIMHAQDRFDAFHENAQQLRKVKMNIDKLKALTEILIPDEIGLNNIRRVKARESILAAFTDGPQNLPEIRGTAWAAFNAITQHVDHNSCFKGKKSGSVQENRMDSLLFGANARFKTSALNIVNQAAQALAK
jgi:phage/plasmid-like protein (TIGR03299 family)